ncbi:MAG: rhomboid family intramembrane serine protease [Flavobacteriales bacterium]|nr:rhomboid family intramembrane serine protease [Flavobacteriales bacterium]
MFRNIPPVTKNLLIVNILFYVVSLFFAQTGTDLSTSLGAHYIGSHFFEPYQVITHMFMHDLTSPLHIIFNMLLLYMFGSHLERIWGEKKYFIFYIACGLGAFVLYNSIGAWQIMELKNVVISQGFDLQELNQKIANQYHNGYILQTPNSPSAQTYIYLTISTMAGASGAIFGLLAGFALLFPNTELQLIFPPIPVKAKYLIGGYMVFEIYNSIYNQGDSIAHLAHVGGAIVGAIFIFFWKKDRKTFY